MILDPNNFGVDSNGFKFSIDRSGLAGELHKLADAIENGGVIPQSIDVTSETKADDYLMYSLTFVYTECEKPAKVKASKPVEVKPTGKVKELHGPGSVFPLDIRKV